MIATLGLVSWRLPGSVTDSPGRVAQLGLRHLQVDYGGPGRAHELRPGGAAESALALAAERAGVTITAVAVNVLNDVGITRRECRRECDRLVDLALLAATGLGAPTVLVPAFRRSAIRSSDDLAATVRFLADAAARGGEMGIRVAYESALAPTRLHDLIEALRGSPVSVVFDVGNLHEFGIDWRAALATAEPHLHDEAHIKDFRRAPAGADALGEGVVPLQQVVDALTRTRRVDRLVLETDHRDAAMSDIATDLCRLDEHRTSATRPHTRSRQ